MRAALGTQRTLDVRALREREERPGEECRRRLVPRDKKRRNLCAATCERVCWQRRNATYVRGRPCPGAADVRRRPCLRGRVGKGCRVHETSLTSRPAPHQACRIPEARIRRSSNECAEENAHGVRLALGDEPRPDPLHDGHRMREASVPCRGLRMTYESRAKAAREKRHIRTSTRRPGTKNESTSRKLGSCAVPKIVANASASSFPPEESAPKS
jgi:hypothetical protein